MSFSPSTAFIVSHRSRFVVNSFSLNCKKSLITLFFSLTQKFYSSKSRDIVCFHLRVSSCIICDTLLKKNVSVNE